jgi:hypothetical protein
MSEREQKVTRRIRQMIKEGATKKTVVADLTRHGFPEPTVAAMYRAGKLLVKTESLVKLEKAERRT